MRQALIVAACVIAVPIAFLFGCECGRYYEAHLEFRQRYDNDLKLVEPVLAADPAFRQVQTINFPVAGICLAGYVKTQDDRNRLRAEMLRLFGESRVGHVMQDVHVESAAKPPVPAGEQKAK